jgi:hypothetical protein
MAERTVEFHISNIYDKLEQHQNQRSVGHNMVYFNSGVFNPPLVSFCLTVAGFRESRRMRESATFFAGLDS